MRFMASTPCYRREAGSAGRDTRGMLRSHEFDKVEILAYATPEQAPAMLDELIARAESTIAALGLPYRIIEICTGDLGQSHHRSFDIEVYAPGVDAWLEVSSISWFSDYQARRANIRYRPLGEKGTGHRAHAQRLGPGRAPGVGGHHREQPPGRRQHRPARGAVAVPARAPGDPGAGRVTGPRGGLMGLADRRSDYDWGTLEREDLDDDPIAQWWVWYDAAVAAGALEPNAMSVATVADDGGPDARLVLARGVDRRGFAFFTNLESAKAQQLAARPVGRGDLRLVGAAPPGQAARIRSSRWRPAEADAYYASRPRSSRIGAWASPQSRVLTDRARARRRGRRGRGPLPGRRGPPPALLGRPAHRSLDDRVLAGPAEPPPRPLPLPPGARVDSPWIIERLAP